MPRGLIVVLAAGLVVAVAVIEGIRSNRWGVSEDVRVAAAKLDRVPTSFGDWVSTELPVDAKSMRVAEAVGCLSREYENRKTRQRVTVMLLCGPTGPIGAHTPDVCYGGLGYKCLGNPTVRLFSPPEMKPVTFWTGRFEKTSPTDDPLRVFWAWSVDGDWEASAEPRREFALRAALYKLYVVRSDNRTSSPGDTEPAEAFLNEFLPVVRNALSSN